MSFRQSNSLWVKGIRSSSDGKSKKILIVGLFHHYCLTARTEFGEVLPHSGQGVLGPVDALTLTADVARVRGDSTFQADDSIFRFVAKLPSHGAERPVAPIAQLVEQRPFKP